MIAIRGGSLISCHEKPLAGRAFLQPLARCEERSKFGAQIDGWRAGGRRPAAPSRHHPRLLLRELVGAVVKLIVGVAAHPLQPDAMAPKFAIELAPQMQVGVAPPLQID